MSVERQKLLRAYGAEVVLTDGKKGMQGSIEKAEELKRTIPGSVIMGQFDNEANPEAHEAATGPEIYRDTDGRVDIFVATVGTGGTLTGTGRYLKNKTLRSGSWQWNLRNPLYYREVRREHTVFRESGPISFQVFWTGIFMMRSSVSPQRMPIKQGMILPNVKGILVGISSGAAVWAAAQLARRPENKGKNIVALLPDTGDHYLSTTMYD